MGEHIRYPKQARKMAVKGRVYVQFIVRNNGEITNVQVIRGIGGGCDGEAARVVAEIPNWTPGSQRGISVHTKMVSPLPLT